MKPGDKKTIKNETYRVALFLITSRKPDGTPHECRRIADNETVDLEGPMKEFFTALVPEAVLAKKAN